MPEHMTKLHEMHQRNNMQLTLIIERLTKHNQALEHLVDEARGILDSVPAVDYIADATLLGEWLHARLAFYKRVNALLEQESE